MSNNKQIEKKLKLPHRETVISTNTLQTKPFDNQKIEIMSNNKQSMLTKILNLFKLKCPKCNGKLTQDFVHHFWGGTEVNGYTCIKCKKQWI